MAVVNKVVSDTQINAISTNGAAVPSSDYAILLSDSLTVDGLAQDVAETLRYYQSQETVIAEAVDFFKDFDLSTLQELVEQAKRKLPQASSQHQQASSQHQQVSRHRQQVSRQRQQVSRQRHQVSRQQMTLKQLAMKFSRSLMIPANSQRWLYWLSQWC